MLRRAVLGSDVGLLVTLDDDLAGSRMESIFFGPQPQIWVWKSRAFKILRPLLTFFFDLFLLFPMAFCFVFVLFRLFFVSFILQIVILFLFLSLRLDSVGKDP